MGLWSRSPDVFACRGQYPGFAQQTRHGPPRFGAGGLVGRLRPELLNRNPGVPVAFLFCSPRRELAHDRVRPPLACEFECDLHAVVAQGCA